MCQRRDDLDVMAGRHRCSRPGERAGIWAKKTREHSPKARYYLSAAAGFNKYAAEETQLSKSLRRSSWPTTCSSARRLTADMP